MKKIILKILLYVVKAVLDYSLTSKELKVLKSAIRVISKKLNKKQK